MTRRRIYLCAALYAEGTSDYEFLSPHIQRLLDSLGNRLFPGMIDVGETLGINAPRPTSSKRAERIAAAVGDHWDAFTLLVVHSDGAGAPDEARQHNITPGIPSDPARDMDPKQSLQRVLQDAGLRHAHKRAHRLFGEEVRFDMLRKLVAFQQFEADLCNAIQAIAREPA